MMNGNGDDSTGTAMAVDEIKRDLQDYLDPADRILVTQVSFMSSRNVISDDRLAHR